MLHYYLSMFIFHAPYTLIDIAGLTYAFTERKKHPRLSMLVMASLGASVATAVLMRVLDHSQMVSGTSPHLNIMRMADVLLGACAHALLIYAVFCGFREGQESVTEKKGKF